LSRRESVILSREEKLAYVEQILLKKMTVPEVVEKTGVHESTVYEWLRKYRDNPGDFMPGSGNSHKDDTGSRALEKRVKELERENEFLKKVAAYFAKSPV